MNIIKVVSILDIPKNSTGIFRTPDGSMFYLLNSRGHRIDGPALNYFVGVRLWCLKGIIYSEEHYWIINRLTRRIK